MASYEFTIQSATGPVKAIVDSDGSLEFSSLDVSYEQAMFEFSGKPSMAYVLFLSWDKLVNPFDSFDSMDESVIGTKDLSRMISECPEIIGYSPLFEIAINDSRFHIYMPDILDSAIAMFKQSFSDLRESSCLSLIRFFRDSHVSMYIDSQPDTSERTNLWTMVFREVHWFKIYDETVMDPWYRFSECMHTDIFFFDSSSREIDREQEYSDSAHMLLTWKIIEAAGLKDFPADDACKYASEKPVVCETGIYGEYALAYYRVRPASEIPYSRIYDEILVQYQDKKEMNLAYQIATAMDASNGGCYDIRRMKRLSYEERVYEDWQQMTEKQRQHVGSFRDWIAQDWMEI